MSKCIKCGRELTSGEIPEFNYGMCDKCYKDYQCKQYPFKKGMFNMQDEIQQLKQQLVEKDKEIKKLNWQLKDKDFIIKNLNHSLSVAPNANAGQRARIDELTKIVKEKDKEIEEILSSKRHFKTCAENMSDVLKTINSVLPKPQKNELNYKKVADDVVALIKEKDKEIEKLKTKQKPIVMHSKEDYFKRCNFLEEENVKLQFAQTQLAIQELEKVKIMTEWKFNSIVDVVEYIDNRIKELKGEKVV